MVRGRGLRANVIRALYHTYDPGGCHSVFHYFNRISLTSDEIRVANDSRLIDSKIMVELKILVVILCHDHAVEPKVG